jgi:transposase
MRPPVFVHALSKCERCALEKLFKQTEDIVLRSHCQIILLSNQHYPPGQIARITCKSDDIVRRIIARYETDGLAGLPDQDRPGRPPTVTKRWKKLLLRVIEQDPHSLGVERPTWTASTLAGYLEHKTHIHVSEACVRQYLSATDYVARRPTWSLQAIAEQQPEFEKKTPRPPNPGASATWLRRLCSG